MSTIKEKKKSMLAALLVHQGRVTHALADCDVTFKQHNEWIKKDSAYRVGVDYVEEAYRDDIEKESWRAIKDGNASVITLALKTKLRGRGYGSEEALGALPETIDIGFDDEP